MCVCLYCKEKRSIYTYTCIAIVQEPLEHCGDVRPTCGQPQVPQVSSGGRGGGGAKGVVEVRHLCRDRGGGQEEAGDVVMETHPAAQVGCDLHVTLM